MDTGDKLNGVEVSINRGPGYRPRQNMIPSIGAPLRGAAFFLEARDVDICIFFILGYTGEWKVKWNLQYWLGFGVQG